MPPNTKLAVTAFFLLGMIGLVTPAGAADLPAQSRLGAVFAEPAISAVRVETFETTNDGALFFVPPKVPGYYGRATDFTYRNYYGTSPLAIFGRLPYACGFHGSC